MDPSTVARLHNLYWSLGTVAFIIAGSLAVGGSARLVIAARGGTVTERNRAFWGYLLVSPWLLGFVIFVLGPAIASLYYSFTDYRLGKPFAWIGLENYRDLLGAVGAQGRRFMQSMYNSFYYAVVGVPLQIGTALGMALLVSRPLPGMSFFRLVFYFPVILAGGPAILLAWRYMLASNGGFINISLRSIADALPPLDWLYRSFIFLSESFNAFYVGLTRNDPVGPLQYLPIALVGTILAAVLLAGAWSSGRRTVARQAAELTCGLFVVILAARAVIATHIGAVLPRTGQLGVLADLVTLRSSIARPDDLDYLQNGFRDAAPSWLWLLLALAVVLFLVESPRFGGQARRWLLGISFLVFGLLSVGAAIDGVRYFGAFEPAAAAAGTVNHHFALFRQAILHFPDAHRVPLWLSSELWSKPSLVLITMWSSGAGMLIFLAALKGVPSVYYEAAKVDGATGWNQFWRITMPLISPAMFYNVVIGMIAALQTFEAVYLIQNTQTENSLASAAYYLFVRTFRQLEIGQGAAASWILAVIIVLLTVLQFRYSRWVHYEG